MTTDLFGYQVFFIIFLSDKTYCYENVAFQILKQDSLVFLDGYNWNH